MATVYAIYRNSDMTEGRGPMVLDTLWATREPAVKYINRQLGVMGHNPFRDHEKLREHRVKNGYPDDKFQGECLGWLCQDCYPYGGEWQIRELLLRN